MDRGHPVRGDHLVNIIAIVVSSSLNIVIVSVKIYLFLERLRLLHQLRDEGGLRRQRRDPAQHRLRGHPQQHGHHHQPPVSMQLQRNIHATY